MKITIYELLGMIKDGKAPKKVKFGGIEWEYTGHQYRRLDKENLGNIWNGYNFNILNDEVEILDKSVEEKKIPEKLSIGLKQTKDGIFNTIVKDDSQYELNEKEEMICKKIHEIIDYLDYLKSKGDE